MLNSCFCLLFFHFISCQVLLLLLDWTFWYFKKKTFVRVDPMQMEFYVASIHTWANTRVVETRWHPSSPAVWYKQKAAKNWIALRHLSETNHFKTVGVQRINVYATNVTQYEDRFKVACTVHHVSMCRQTKEMQHFLLMVFIIHYLALHVSEYHQSITRSIIS